MIGWDYRVVSCLLLKECLLLSNRGRMRTPFARVGNLGSSWLPGHLECMSLTLGLRLEIKICHEGIALITTGVCLGTELGLKRCILG
jgi:hypothetical protein